MFFAHLRRVFPLCLFVCCRRPFLACLLSVCCAEAFAQESASTSIPVLISDSELFSSAPVPPLDPAKADAVRITPPKDAPPAVFEASDIPSVQARRLMDFFAATLVQSFQKAGYNAARRQGNVNSPKGVLLRGIFAEADTRNRIRRALLGGGSPSAKLLLYVGTFNLARPDQPLYEQALQQYPESRYGPIITVNNYIPMVRFELSKNPTEDEVRRICNQIVQNLGALLKANPSSFAQ